MSLTKSMESMRCFSKFNNDRMCDLCYVTTPSLHKECRKEAAIIYHLKDKNTCTYVSNVRYQDSMSCLFWCNKSKSYCLPTSKCLEHCENIQDILEKVEAYLND